MDLRGQMIRNSVEVRGFGHEFCVFSRIFVIFGCNWVILGDTGDVVVGGVCVRGELGVSEKDRLALLGLCVGLNCCSLPMGHRDGGHEGALEGVWVWDRERLGIGDKMWAERRGFGVQMG